MGEHAEQRQKQSPRQQKARCQARSFHHGLSRISQPAGSARKTFPPGLIRSPAAGPPGGLDPDRLFPISHGNSPFQFEIEQFHGFQCGMSGCPMSASPPCVNRTDTGRRGAGANYSFCTIEPQHRRSRLSDPRLKRLARWRAPGNHPDLDRLVDIAGPGARRVQGARSWATSSSNIAKSTHSLHVWDASEDDTSPMSWPASIPSADPYTIRDRADYLDSRPRAPHRLQTRKTRRSKTRDVTDSARVMEAYPQAPAGRQPGAPAQDAVAE